LYIEYSYVAGFVGLGTAVKVQVTVTMTATYTGLVPDATVWVIWSLHVPM